MDFYRTRAPVKLTQEELREQRDLDVKYFKICMEVMDEMSNQFWKKYEEDLEWRRKEMSPELPTETLRESVPESTPCEPAPLIMSQPASAIEPIKIPGKLPSEGGMKHKKGKKKSRKPRPHSVPQNANVWDFILRADLISVFIIYIYFLFSFPKHVSEILFQDVFLFHFESH